MEEFEIDRGWLWKELEARGYSKAEVESDHMAMEVISVMEERYRKAAKHNSPLPSRSAQDEIS